MSLGRFAVVIFLLAAISWASHVLWQSYERGQLLRTKSVISTAKKRVQKILSENLNQTVSPKKSEVLAPVISADLVEELSLYSHTQKLARDRNVKSLLSTEHRNPEIIMARLNSVERRELIAGAKIVLPVLAKCLADGSRCGNTENWDEYYAIGGAPLHQILERAMNVLSLASDQGEKLYLSREDLLLAARVPHHSIAVNALHLLTSGPITPAEFTELISLSDDMKGRSKRLYFQMLGASFRSNKSELPRAAYVKAIYQSLAPANDRWTQDHVIAGLDKYPLKENEFARAVKLSCQAVQEKSGENVRAQLGQVLDAKARRKGFHISAVTICQNSHLPEFVDR